MEYLKISSNDVLLDDRVVTSCYLTKVTSLNRIHAGSRFPHLIDGKKYTLDTKKAEDFAWGVHCRGGQGTKWECVEEPAVVMTTSEQVLIFPNSSNHSGIEKSPVSLSSGIIRGAFEYLANPTQYGFCIGDMLCIEKNDFGDMGNNEDDGVVKPICFPLYIRKTIPQAIPAWDISSKWFDDIQMQDFDHVTYDQLINKISIAIQQQ